MSQFHSALDKSVPGLKALIQGSLKFSLARDSLTATKRDWWLATSKAVQGIIVERMIATATAHNNRNAKRVYYLSLEFLMGRLFSNSLYSAGLNGDMVHALEELGLDYEELRHEEYDMGLGNGGLGRLASCFLDSLATLDLPAIGYGIHYQYGLFKQEFRNGYQVELPDAWMQYGTPWEIVRPEHTTEIQVYGYVENVFDDRGNYVPRWMGWKKLVGIPYDIPVPGYGTNTVNFLRLWESRAPEEFDLQFQIAFMNVKQANKVDLARIIKRDCGVEVNPGALFDVHIKRLHEYKRQHLNLLHILALYRRLLQNPGLVITPRVFIFAAKAAPGYDMAKCIIKTINAVGKCINNDKRIEDKIKVVFLPNYRVSLAQRIVPAADLSEQISTAGKEASGTGNMKLALNGALTIGTLDGANVEIMEEVGEDNIFIFGLTVDEVHALLKKGYNPQEYYMKNEELRAVVDWVGSNYFTPEEPPGVLSMLRDNLFYSDPFLCLADFASYSECQKKVDAAFRQKSHWAKMAILNTARVGKFSSDRAITEYARDIWNLEPIHI